MFDDLFSQLCDLPYDEQVLFYDIIELLLKAYNDSIKSSSRASAIEVVRGVLNDIQNSIDVNDIGRSK